jgi:hypothetical protein
MNASGAGPAIVPACERRGGPEYIFGLSRASVSPSLWSRLSRNTPIRFRVEGRLAHEVEVLESVDGAGFANPDPDRRAPGSPDRRIGGLAGTGPEASARLSGFFGRRAGDAFYYFGA